MGFKSFIQGMDGLMVLNAEFMMSEFLQLTESPISVKNKTEKKTVNLEIRVLDKSESFREMLRIFFFIMRCILGSF